MEDVESSWDMILSPIANEKSKVCYNLPDYDPSKPESYLSYIDANNLYGWAMCQKLPISGFKWQKPGKLLTVDDIMAWDPDVT